MRRAKIVLTAVLVGSVLTGCGLFGGDADADREPGPTGGGSPSSSAAPSQTQAQGPTAEDLFEELWAERQEADEAPPAASSTGTFGGGQQLTIDVMSVQRLTSGTLVRMRWSGPDETTVLGGSPDWFTGPNNALSLRLVDRQVSQSTYRPYGYQEAQLLCACPQLPVEVGEDPQTLMALYPPLPDGVTAVDLDANGYLVIPDVPVTG